MLDWVVEPYVTALLAPIGWELVADAFRVCGFEEEDVWGRVNSSKKSANRAWCMCMCVAEESLLWWVVSWWCWFVWGSDGGADTDHFG
jgi:hypothetical protein